MSSSSFSALGVPAHIVARLEARSITAPFPIQTAAIPDALAGRDVCGRAPTGSGKTIAFGIALVANIKQGKSRRPTGLVLVPTRELAAQVTAELESLAGGNRHAAVALYGGVGYRPQIDRLRRGVDIVVACPGRLTDLVNQGHLRLDDVETVVIDEADRMADMGFLPEVRRLLDQVKPDRQTLLFSATLDGEVDVLVSRYQRDPVVHDVVTDEKGPSNRHLFWHLDRADRVAVVADVIGAHSPAIVFCRTKHGADRLAKQLAKAGISAAAIHGDRSQAQRERALAAFTRGNVQALVATDVAARGIHVDDVATVIHFDLAATAKDYLHRSGRTGRGGASGIVVCLVDSDAAKAGRALQRELGYEPSRHRPDLDALGDGRHDARPADPATAATHTTPTSTQTQTRREFKPRRDRDRRSGARRANRTRGNRSSA